MPERTFSAIRDFLPNSFFGKILRGLIALLHWDIDGESAVRKLTGRTLVVHHPDDSVMSPERSLYNALFKSRTPVPANVQELDLSRGLKLENAFLHGVPMKHFDTPNFKAEEDVIQFLFNADRNCSEQLLQNFSSYPAELRNRTFGIVAEHVVGGGYWMRRVRESIQPESAQESGSYFGSGEDAFYDRNGQSATADQRVNAIFQAKWEEAAERAV